MLMRRGIRFTFLLAVGLWASSASHGQSLFNDQFTDGSATDGAPTNWQPSVYTNGEYSVINGDFVLAPRSSQEPLVAVEAATVVKNVSLRTQVRTTGLADGVALFARFQEGTFTYQGGIDTLGEVYIGWNDNTTKYHDLANTLTDLRPQDEDVILQFDVFDDQLSLYAWRPSEPKPIVPTVQVSDSLSSAAAKVGILFDPQTLGTASFRYIMASTQPIPEPHGLSLMLGGGLLAMQSIRRRFQSE